MQRVELKVEPFWKDFNVCGGWGKPFLFLWSCVRAMSFGSKLLSVLFVVGVAIWILLDPVLLEWENLFANFSIPWKQAHELIAFVFHVKVFELIGFLHMLHVKVMPQPGDFELIRSHWCRPKVFSSDHRTNLMVKSREHHETIALITYGGVVTYVFLDVCENLFGVCGNLLQRLREPFRRKLSLFCTKGGSC